jgi:hypothetical protein
VRLTSFGVEGGDDKDHIEAHWDGSCLKGRQTSTYTSYPESFSYDPDDPTTWEPPHTNGVTEAHTDDFDSCSAPSSESSNGTSLDFGVLGIFGDVRPDSAVVVVQKDGRWYVSPVRTVFDSILSTLRRLSPEQLRTWAQKMAEREKNCCEGTVYPGGSMTPGTAVTGSGSTGTIVPGPTGSVAGDGYPGGSGGGRTSSGTAVAAPGSTVSLPVPSTQAPPGG